MTSKTVAAMLIDIDRRGIGIKIEREGGMWTGHISQTANVWFHVATANTITGALRTMADAATKTTPPGLGQGVWWNPEVDR